MNSKYDLEKLKTKYATYVEKAYNLKFNAPGESDYYAHKAKKILLKINLLDSSEQQKRNESIV